MKDEIVCIVIFFILIGFFVTNNYVIDTHTQNIIKAIDDAQNFEDCKSIIKEWNGKKKHLFYTCSHTLLMQIDENLTFALDYMEEDDIARARHSLKKAKIILRDLSEREKIKLDNIF